MIAASAPENGVSFEWAWEIIEEPSFGEYKEAGRGAGVCSINGDWGARPAPVIMGEAEPIEPWREGREFCLSLARRTRRKARIPKARIAKKPRTTMTAIAQWGKSGWELSCRLPGVGEVVVEAAEAAEAEAADDERAIDDATESAIVVSVRC
jgi:hypothetical protein